MNEAASHPPKAKKIVDRKIRFFMAGLGTIALSREMRCGAEAYKRNDAQGNENESRNQGPDGPQIVEPFPSVQTHHVQQGNQREHPHGKNQEVERGVGQPCIGPPR